MMFLPMILSLMGCAAEPSAMAEAPVVPVAANPAAADAPDLVIIAIAGLREDAETQAAERFMAALGEAPTVRFTNAYSVTPNAYVSLGTILSGRYPTATPLCGLTSPPGPLPDDAPWCNRWPKSVPSLPGVLALYGYRTALVTANLAGAGELGKQFQSALPVAENWANVRSDWTAVSALAGAWWRADTTHPRLLVVATNDLAVLSRPDILAAMKLSDVEAGGHIDRTAVVAAYANAAVEAGKGVKQLVAALAGSAGGTERRRTTVITGLHGINLGEAAAPWQALRAGSWNDILLDRTLHVPLAILTSAPAQRREEQVVELIDLLPTLIARTEAVLPAGLHGQDVLAADFLADPDATAYAEFGDMLAVRQGNWMWSGRAFFHNRSSLDPELTDFFVGFVGDSPKFHLHDVARDPFQRKELLAAHLDEARRMNALLLSIRTGAGAAPPSEMDARRIWDLRMSPADGYW